MTDAGAPPPVPPVPTAPPVPPAPRLATVTNVVNMMTSPMEGVLRLLASGPIAFVSMGLGISFAGFAVWGRAAAPATFSVPVFLGLLGFAALLAAFGWTERLMTLRSWTRLQEAEIKASARGLGRRARCSEEIKGDRCQLVAGHDPSVVPHAVAKREGDSGLVVRRWGPGDPVARVETAVDTTLPWCAFPAGATHSP